MMTFSRGLALRAATLSLFATLVATSLPARAQLFCLFDPLGTAGDAYASAKDYALAAKRWNVNLELKVYTDEGVAVEDFKAGQCDMVLMTGLRARQFNQFTGTIDAVGAIENYNQMHNLMDLMASPKLDKVMVSGSYEVVGIIPLGAGYAFVNDRSINQLAKAAGKKIAVMDWDKTQAILAQHVGAQAVMSDITTYGGKFNNGQVDIIVAPAILYKPFELYKGLGTRGGIDRFPIIQLTAQMLTHRDKFPAGFGEQSREYVAHQVERAFGTIRNEENQIDSKYWIYVQRSEREGYTRVMREARIHLAKEGFYDKRMLNLMKRVRCKAEPDDAECSLGDE